MTVLLVTDPSMVDHDTGAHHPEAPERLVAVLDALTLSPVRDALVHVAPRSVSTDDLHLVHSPEMVLWADAACARGKDLDPDTPTVPQSWSAALLAAGAGLAAVDALAAGAGDAAFCAVRPPGHHATPKQSMGFCVFNNIAVTAASLAAAGERVLIVDFDAHHGNGTQDAFFSDPRVMFVSWHQWPLYPGTGRADEVGEGAGIGTTLNLPVPPGTTGDHYRASFDDIVAPVVEHFAPTWLLVSAGFDSHHHDPLGSLGLTSGDYADVMAQLIQCVPTGRTIVFLEGGYDLDALGVSAVGCVSVLAGERVIDEAPTAGGPGASALAQAAEIRRIALEGE